jgi:hypothetical protein
MSPSRPIGTISPDAFCQFRPVPRGGERPTPTQPLRLNETRRLINLNVQEKGCDVFRVFKLIFFKFSSCSKLLL